MIFGHKFSGNIIFLWIRYVDGVPQLGLHFSLTWQWHGSLHMMPFTNCTIHILFRHNLIFTRPIILGEEYWKQEVFLLCQTPTSTWRLRCRVKNGGCMNMSEEWRVGCFWILSIWYKRMLWFDYNFAEYHIFNYPTSRFLMCMSACKID